METTQSHGSSLTRSSKSSDTNMTDPNERFGPGTIEGAFNNDIEHAIENDQDITICSHEKLVAVDRIAIGTIRLEHDAEDVVRMGYELRAPSNLGAVQGTNVAVTGYNGVWVFTDVTVTSQTDEQTIIQTKHIERIQHEA
jgi:hypothetical protein